MEDPEKNLQDDQEIEEVQKNEKKLNQVLNLVRQEDENCTPKIEGCNVGSYLLISQRKKGYSSFTIDMISFIKKIFSFI
jgi:hypothetical protein